MDFYCSLCHQNFPSKSHLYQATHQQKVQQKLNTFFEEYSKILLFLNNPVVIDKEWSQPSISCLFCNNKLLITKDNTIACYDLIEHFGSKSHVKKVGLFWKFQKPNNGERMRRREEFIISESELEKFKLKCDKLISKGEAKLSFSNDIVDKCEISDVRVNFISSNNNDKPESSNINKNNNIIQNSSLNLGNTIRNPNSIPPWLMNKESKMSINNKNEEVELLGPNLEDFIKFKLKKNQLKRNIEQVENLDNWKPKFGGVFTLKGSRKFNRERRMKKKKQ